MPTHTLNKSERLKSYIRIRELFTRGRKIWQFPLILFYSIEKKHDDQQGEPLKMGVSVSTRSFKKAVDRNLVKRRIREAYRTQNGDLKLTVGSSDFTLDVFFVFTDHKLPDYQMLTASIHTLLTKLNQYFIERTNEHTNDNG